MAKFRTSARTVDMLGRQQIAGVPTAISELYKNAHDAYATQVTGDLFREQNLLVIRDNGRGMSEDDFEERWLMLGTDSKLGPQKSPRGFKRRQMLGEKGIGRLAIALLGPQVLVMTRPKLGKAGGDLTIALIDWRVFEIPGVALDDIDVPTKVLPGGSLPSENDVRGLARRLVENAELLTTDKELAQTIRTQALSFWADFRTLDTALGHPSLSEEGHGTHFIVTPVGEAVYAALDSTEKDKPSDVVKLLIGFTNTMTPGHSEPPLVAAFNDHRSNDDVRRLADENEFFTPEEFEVADHRIRGAFDGNGWFRGEVRVFGQTPQPYEIPPPSRVAVPTRCGLFSFDLGVVQPELKSSMLPPEKHGDLIRKTRNLGSLYVYRDSIRILPYGDIEFDWLEVEQRRSLINLVDNALFWLRDTSQPRLVRLDARGKTIMVCDSGPGVIDRDVDRIFDRGFTRKLAGRGLGLYISSQVLREEGFSISARATGALGGACFEIEPEELHDT